VEHRGLEPIRQTLDPKQEAGQGGDTGSQQETRERIEALGPRSAAGGLAFLTGNSFSRLRAGILALMCLYLNAAFRTYD